MLMNVDKHEQLSKERSTPALQFVGSVPILLSPIHLARFLDACKKENMSLTVCEVYPTQQDMTPDLTCL